MFGFFRSKGPFNASISPNGKVIKVEAGENLLKAALSQGLAWPHNCRVGSCGQCRCKLVDGKIKPLSDFSYVLSGEEMDAGIILACQTRLKSDVEIEVTLDQPEVALSQPKTVNGQIAQLTPLTHDILEVRIDLEEHMPDYLAGQYAELVIPGVIDKPRSYSFAMAPDNNEPKQVSFFIRHVPGGQMTSWLHDKQSKVGQKVTVTGPYGSFWLRQSDGPMLCIAGGSGMAPIKAILEEVKKRDIKRDIVYVFGARTQEDLYCLEQMNQFVGSSRGRFHFIPILSREPSDSSWGGLRGHCTDFLLQHISDTPKTHAYLCGPPEMIDSAIMKLTKAGVPENQIFYDKFLDSSHTQGSAN